jgi:aspartate/glutamate racemase
MSTVAAIYTAQTIVEPVRQLFAEILPGCRLINIIDDSLIQDVIRAGRVTSAVARRLIRYYFAAAETGAEVIFNTCSSVGDVTDLARALLNIPIVRIDERMAYEAVRTASKVGVLATLPTTLAPTVRLVKTQAEKAGRSVSVIEGLATGAYECLVANQVDKHDRLILETAERLASEADVLVLAQGSMARMEEALAKRTGKPVLSSPRSGVLEVKETLERMGR